MHRGVGPRITRRARLKLPGQGRPLEHETLEVRQEEGVFWMKGMFGKAGKNLTPSDQKEVNVAAACEQGAGCQRMKLEEARGHRGGRGKKLDFILSAMQHLELKPHFITHTPESISEIRAPARKTPSACVSRHQLSPGSLRQPRPPSGVHS